MLGQVEEMLSFYEWRTEDSATKRKNAGSSVSNAVFL
jgi:hypothetical protein